MVEFATRARAHALRVSTRSRSVDARLDLYDSGSSKTKNEPKRQAPTRRTLCATRRFVAVIELGGGPRRVLVSPAL
jgi:hypothetical protein